MLMPAVRHMRLSTLARLSGRPICMPSAGYAAIALSGTSVADNLRDGTLMYKTLASAITGFDLEADGTVSDLTVEPEACGCRVALPEKDTPWMDGLSLDHPVDLADALSAVPEDMLVIGNVDPVGVMLEGDPAGVRAAAAELIERFGNSKNFVLGTGCDLPIETPLENIDALFAAAE
jgi:uroporphyrinogen-III decarboxylase